MSHPSFEADDERSSFEHDPEMASFEGDEDINRDEDDRPTTQKELAGWYSYGWASEVFVVCAVGSFLPITLEQLARDRGVLLSDKVTPCNAAGKTPASSNNPVHILSTAAPSCVVYIGGLEINTASFAMYTFSLSVLMQSLLIISMSAAADHGRFRKRLLIIFAIIGSLATMLFLAITSRVYLIGSLLAIIGNTGFGASFVLLNSFLPLMVRYHPSINPTHEDDHDTNYHEEDQEEEEMANSTTSLLPQDRPDHTKPMAPSPAALSPALKLSTKISAYGIGIGYTAALFVQILAIIVVYTTGSSTFSMRLALFVVGCWWLVFTIPAALWLRPRPGPPLPARHSNAFAYVAYSWRALFRTIGRARKLKDLVLFLVAWFLLSDAVATVSGTAVLFAKTNLGMKVSALALISVISTVFGVVGAFCWSSLSRLLNLSASRTIVACICLFELIPLYGLLGFIPAVKRLGFLGLQQPIEIYFLAAVYGFIMGGLSSYCRSFFGELIPPGFEAAFYALYAITDKGSSIFGPAIVGVITDIYGDIRPAFVFLAVLIFLPLPLMWLVNVDRGKVDARALAAELDEKEHRQANGDSTPSVPQIRLSEDD